MPYRLFLVFQPANTAFGVGFNPLNLKWNFATRGRVVPYLELSGGTLFTNHDVPTGTDRVNFTSSAALGAHFLGDVAQLERRVAVYAYFQCRPVRSESWDQHGAGAIGHRKVFRKRESKK